MMDIQKRVKTIDQKAFDELVRENIIEFELELNEAVEDAIKQLNHQNVELSNIVKSYEIDENGEPFHPVLAALEKIKSICNTNSIKECKQNFIHFETMKNECDKEISYRILAAQNSAYPALISCCQNNMLKTSSNFHTVLEALHCLTKGQPDLLNSNDVPFLLEFLTSLKDDSSKVIILKLFQNFCIKHETNRQNLIASTLLKEVFDIMAVNESPSVLFECCNLIWLFTLDDDIRVPFGKAHDHAKLIVGDFKALEVLSNLLEKFNDDSKLVSEILLTLTKLAVRNEFCQEIMEKNGLKNALASLVTHIQHQNVVKNSLLLIKATAGNDDVRKAIIDSGGASPILNAVQYYLGKSASVVEAGCVAVSMLAMRNTNNCICLMQSGAASILTNSMKVYPNHKGIQKSSCMAIRNLISRTKQFIPDFIEQDVETLINLAKSNLKIEDETKAALRDLGCKIELKELWKGEHGDVCKSFT